MKRSRFLPCCIAVCLVAGLISGCSRGPSEEEQKLAQLEEQLVTLQQQFTDLQQARSDLGAAEVTLSEIEAIKESDRSEEQMAELEVLPTTIEELTATKDLAFEAAQGTLANFLNVALNEFPEHPATAQGLTVYSDEAIMIARETVIQSGDYKKAINQLDAAVSYYESIGLTPYQPLVDEIAELDDMRFVTQERFDLVVKNMTKDEVKDAVGVPYYQNIQIDEKRGVETWLYRKRAGGAAAVYFRIKSDKAYDKNWEAVKMKVVE